MRRALLFAAIALFAPVNARGQGAILKSLDDLKAVPEPPGGSSGTRSRTECPAASRSGRDLKLCVVGGDLCGRVAGWA